MDIDVDYVQITAHSALGQWQLGIKYRQPWSRNPSDWHTAYLPPFEVKSDLLDDILLAISEALYNEVQ